MKLSGANIFDFIPTNLSQNSKRDSPMGRVSSEGSLSDLEDPSVANDSESKGDPYGSMRKRHSSNYSSKHND
jgi:hypothetical protein